MPAIAPSETPWIVSVGVRQRRLAAFTAGTALVVGRGAARRSGIDRWTAGKECVRAAESPVVGQQRIDHRIKWGDIVPDLIVVDTVDEARRPRAVADQVKAQAVECPAQ